MAQVTCRLSRHHTICDIRSSGFQKVISGIKRKTKSVVTNFSNPLVVTQIYLPFRFSPSDMPAISWVRTVSFSKEIIYLKCIFWSIIPLWIFMNGNMKGKNHLMETSPSQLCIKPIIKGLAIKRWYVLNCV